MKLLAPILVFAGLLSGCVSASKRQAEFDQALSQIQSGSSEQGRAALEGLCLKGATGACALLGKEASPRNQLAVMQSVTSDSQSRFVIVLPRSETAMYFVRHGDVVERLEPQRSARGFSRYATDQIEAFRLAPKENYELLIVGGGGELWDKRTFKALDVKRQRARIAVLSCMDQTMAADGEKMWAQLLAQKPDAMLFVGDNVYTDKPKRTGAMSAEVVWDTYALARNELPVFKTPHLIPVIAVWDDHDYGKNDGDRTYAYKDQALETFLSFFAQRQPGPGFERGPGAASVWSAFGVQFTFLDDRSFRSPNGLDIPDQTHFGVDQEKWLQERLLAATTPVWLISGDQFFGGYHKFESYQGNHPKSFAEQLAEWKKSKAPVLFVSGDRHLSEILNVPAAVLGYPTFEITSSGMHAKLFPGSFKRDPSPQQLAGAEGMFNYSIVELMRAERGKMQAAVQAFGPDQKLLYQKTLTVKNP